MAVFSLTPAAYQYLADVRASLENDFKHGGHFDGLIWVPNKFRTKEAVMEEYWRIYNRTVAEGASEVDPSSQMRIQCGHCKEVSNVSRDVKEFKCKCSPHEIQHTFMNRII